MIADLGMGTPFGGYDSVLPVVAWIVGPLAVLCVVFALIVLSQRRRRPPAATAPAERFDSAAPAAPLAGRTIGELISVRDHLAALSEQEKPDVVEVLDYAVLQADALGASDIHLTPTPDGVKLAMRVDGLLYDLAAFRGDARAALLIRLKVLSKLNVYKRDAPQDGRIVVPGPRTPIEIRLSVLPTVHGEKAVLRFIGRSSFQWDLETLGMDDDMLVRYRGLCSRPQGMIFVTGPTGSGKTTTMYASLAVTREVRGSGVNIVTIEDPVEYVVSYLNQTQVREDVGLTFAAGLRSLLRQDPNVIMVGEIRDKETAEIAMQAGLTGHLIFSTVHAESSAGVFTRLLNMGVEPFVLASASAAVVGQRLLRRICPACRVECDPEPHQIEQLRRLRAPERFLDGPYHRGSGCKACLGMGVVGRTGLFELLEVDDRVRELIVKEVPTQEIHAAAAQAGMRPLLVAGLERARAGSSSLDEVLAVVGA